MCKSLGRGFRNGEGCGRFGVGVKPAKQRWILMKVLAESLDPAVCKNSISLKRLVEDCPWFGVIGFADESDFGPIFFCCDLDRRLDESASAACHRIFDRGESSY